MAAFDLPPQLWLPPKPAIIRAASTSDLELIRQARRERGFMFPVVPPSLTAATRTLVTSPSPITTQTTFTFSSQALGTPSGTSLVVVVAQTQGSGVSGEAINSITIDGSAGTIHQNARGFTLAGSSGICAIASRATSNTTGTIVVTCNSTMGSCRIEIYRLNKLVSATPNHSNQATGAPSSGPSTTINVLIRGIVIAGFGTSWNSTPSVSGVTQDSAGTSPASAWGSDQNQAAATGRSISATAGGSSTCGLAVVAWQ